MCPEGHYQVAKGTLEDWRVWRGKQGPVGFQMVGSMLQCSSKVEVLGRGQLVSARTKFGFVSRFCAAKFKQPPLSKTFKFVESQKFVDNVINYKNVEC